MTTLTIAYTIQNGDEETLPGSATSVAIKLDDFKEAYDGVTSAETTDAELEQYIMSAVSDDFQEKFSPEVDATLLAGHITALRAALEGAEKAP